MSVTFTGRIWKTLAVFTVIAAMAVIVACQFHALPLDDEYPASPEHRHTSSTHVVSDALCVLAVPPAVASLVLLSFFLWYTSLLLFRHTARVFLLFIPPENTARF